MIKNSLITIPRTTLKADEDILTYLEASAEENDPALMAHALGTIARARNMSQLARYRIHIRGSLQGLIGRQ